LRRVDPLGSAADREEQGIYGPLLGRIRLNSIAQQERTMHNGRVMNLEEYPAHVECDRSARATAPELGEDHLVARIAHDLSNVLSTICGYGALAQLKLAPGETSDYIDNVLRASAHARVLTQQLFAVGRGGSDPDIAVCIQRIVEETLEWIAITLPERIQLQTALRAPTAHVLAHATHLYQIVMNLCTNAVHAMEHRGVLTVFLDEVSVPIARATTHGSLFPGVYVRLSVSDTGSGISPAVLEQIFDAFFTTKATGRGNGLGLAIVRKIVHALGGAIDVRTEVGVGSTFAVWLRAGEVAVSCTGN
jgi:signal transduction histidine kinase